MPFTSASTGHLRPTLDRPQNLRRTPDSVTATVVPSLLHACERELIKLINLGNVVPLLQVCKLISCCMSGDVAEMSPGHKTNPLCSLGGIQLKCASVANPIYPDRLIIAALRGYRCSDMYDDHSVHISMLAHVVPLLITKL